MAIATLPVISPDPLRAHEPDYLPAYLSNGVVGLRVREIPLVSGACIVSGLAGLDPVDDIEGAPYTPYPLALDIAVNRVWITRVLDGVREWEQRYDFSCGELHSRFVVDVAGVRVTAEIVTFCSRTQPSLVCQETAIEVDGRCRLSLRTGADTANVPGRCLEPAAATPGLSREVTDAAFVWETRGGLSTCGLAYHAAFGGADDVRSGEPDFGADARLRTTRTFDARPARRYTVRQIAAVVGSVAHHQPDRAAVRMLMQGRDTGFETLRRDNQAEWNELWKARPILHGADRTWQALADSAFFYLNSSVHAGSVSSTHLFGLSRWFDYHYYYGHVMWDLEVFALPPTLLSQPRAARAMLDYRYRSLPAARMNARLLGNEGVQFPWESEPARGEEATPLGGKAPHFEQHVGLGVARAFTQFADATGDLDFVRDQAWPVLRGVAEFIAARSEKSERGYEIRHAMGIAERDEPADNLAYINMSAAVVLRDAVAMARRVGLDPPRAWADIADHLVLPMKGDVVLDHDGYEPSEEKGATPGVLAGIFPMGYELDPRVERATTEFYLSLWKDYIGSPMLSALYGTWAARIGDREQAALLLDEGYAKFVSPRFANVHEWRDDRFPEQPPAGPFFANLGGFLLNCYFGLPRLRITNGPPSNWGEAPVVLPTGWERIEIERVWVRGGPHRVVAEHGADRTIVEPTDE
jgi:hypothetical protein